MNKKARIIPILFLIFIIILAGVLAGCSKSSQTQFTPEEPAEPVKPPVLVPIEGFHVYENPEAGIRIQYPENWDKKEGENGAAFIIPKDPGDSAYYEGFNLLFEQMHGIKMSLDEYLEITIDGMKKYMPGFELIESSETTLGGHPACQMLYLGIHEAIEMKFFSMFALRKGNIYALSFNTRSGQFDAYKETYEKITGSFQFLH